MLFNRAVFGVSAVFLVLALGGSGAWLSDVKAATASTEIRHKAVKRVDAGKRLEIEARVRDSEGVNVVRAYFKARDAADFSFVVMHSGRGDRFSGTLPAAAPDAGWVDYLILVKNGANQVVKSQTFRTQVRESDRVAAVSYDKPVRVFTELQQAPRMVAGFQDNIVLDVVASAARYGVVAGVTDAGRAGAVGTAGGGAQGMGTVAATAGGGAGAAVAVLGGLAVAGGGAAAGTYDDDSSGGGGNDGGGGPVSPTSCPWAGEWVGTYRGVDCDGFPLNGDWIGTVDSRCIFLGFDNFNRRGFLEGLIDPSTGRAPNLTGPNTDCGTLTGQADFSGSVENRSGRVSGTLRLSRGGSGTWSGQSR